MTHRASGLSGSCKMSECLSFVQPQSSSYPLACYLFLSDAAQAGQPLLPVMPFPPKGCVVANLLSCTCSAFSAAAHARSALPPLLGSDNCCSAFQGLVSTFVPGRTAASPPGNFSTSALLHVRAVFTSVSI